jgi:UDPglucose 6-dehydrogenase
VLALLTIAEENHVAMRIAESVLVANEIRKRSLARRVAKAIDGSLRGKSVALLGLTFKPNTDDMRESPAIALVAGLRDMDANIRAYEPAGTDQARKILGDEVTYCASPYEAARASEVMVLVTDWPQFRTLDFERLKRVMRTPTIVDLRNAYKAQEMINRGFRYRGIGVSHESGPTPSVDREWPSNLGRRSPRAANGHGMTARKHESTRAEQNAAPSARQKIVFR